jgi:hypothetical protein
MKKILIAISILLFSCSETSDQNRIPDNQTPIEFKKQTALTKEIIDSLGTVSVYRQKGFILYCKKGSYSDSNKKFLFTQVDEAISKVEKVLKIKQLTRGFYLIMLDSRDEMERMIGYKYKGLSIRRDDLALFVYNSKIRPYFTHELFHLLAYQVWGDSKSRVLNEGGAVYTDNKCLHYKNPVTVINKYLYQNNKWFNIEKLINNFSDKAAENDMIAYLEAAYIFKYLYENYGEEKMIKLWQNGFPEIQKIYGFDIRQLEKNINKEMNNIEYKNVDWSELMEKGCG